MSIRRDDAERAMTAVLRRLAAGDREPPVATDVATACAWQAERAAGRVRTAALASPPGDRLERMLDVLVAEDDAAPSCVVVWLRGRRSGDRTITDACGAARDRIAATIAAVSGEVDEHPLPEILLGGLVWSVEAGAVTPTEAVRRALSLVRTPAWDGVAA